MSYEGYSQYLCKKGHYWEEDCLYSDYEEVICPHCGGKPVWENMVDTTNDAGNPVKLKKLSEERCPCCGVVKETIYKIPKKRRRK